MGHNCWGWIQTQLPKLCVRAEREEGGIHCAWHDQTGYLCTHRNVLFWGLFSVLPPHSNRVWLFVSLYSCAPCVRRGCWMPWNWSYSFEWACGSSGLLCWSLCLFLCQCHVVLVRATQKCALKPSSVISLQACSFCLCTFVIWSTLCFNMNLKNFRVFKVPRRASLVFDEDCYWL